MIFIRPETPRDYEPIYELVQKSFAQAEHCDGNEQDLVVKLRNSPAFIPELSLVAEEDGQIIGYIMFSKLKIGGTVQLAVAPLAVLPRHRNRGIGGRLIKTGHQIARNLGYEFAVLLGYPEYYLRFGYLPASTFGIKCPFDVPDECFMALNLQNRKTFLNETVEYPEAFL